MDSSEVTSEVTTEPEVTESSAADPDPGLMNVKLEVMNPEDAAAVAVTEHNDAEELVNNQAEQDEEEELEPNTSSDFGGEMIHCEPEIHINDDLDEEIADHGDHGAHEQYGHMDGGEGGDGHVEGGEPSSSLSFLPATGNWTQHHYLEENGHEVRALLAATVVQEACAKKN